ncbi:MAG: hypothetical protein WD768_10400 [Phycisphaeraceae bacterium]
MAFFISSVAVTDLGECLTRWTVRAALLCYFIAVSMYLLQRQRWAARWLFTTGCALFIAHVFFAFHVFHHWSHAHALEETARQTEALTGVRTGVGLWLNYLFTLLWIGETIAWWDLDARLGKGRSVRVTVHAFMLFIIFNATVVFETGWVRWLGASGCALILGLAIHRWRQDRITRIRPISPSRPDEKSQ